MRNETTTTVADVREDWDVHSDRALIGPVVLTDQGQPSVVIISYDLYERFLDTYVEVVKASGLTRAELDHMRAGIEAMPDDPGPRGSGGHQDLGSR
jgi:PHD/YefM family antitoxin component YafN of YafNO toxin-antitoxin module